MWTCACAPRPRDLYRDLDPHSMRVAAWARPRPPLPAGEDTRLAYNTAPRPSLWRAWWRAACDYYQENVCTITSTGTRLSPGPQETTSLTRSIRAFVLGSYPQTGFTESRSARPRHTSPRCTIYTDLPLRIEWRRGHDASTRVYCSTHVLTAVLSLGDPLLRESTRRRRANSHSHPSAVPIAPLPSVYEA
jgi:hypothetical protein